MFSDTLHYMILLLAFSTSYLVTMAFIKSKDVTKPNTQEDVLLDKNEQDTWYELVATFHIE